MASIIGINCVYGVLVSAIDLANVLQIDIEDLHDVNIIVRELPTGLALFSHPEWDSDCLLLGVTIFKLDVDPSQSGSRTAPVITLPDAIDFTPFSDSQPKYYQMTIYEDDF